jgi:hypothetical protein
MTNIYKAIVYTLLYGTALAMGIASVILSALEYGSQKTLGIILGIGLLCLVFAGIANIKPDDSEAS